MLKVENNVLMQTIAERAARSIAAMLKRMGYTQAIIENCRNRTVLEIAAYYEPYDQERRENLVRDAAKAAELQP